MILYRVERSMRTCRASSEVDPGNFSARRLMLLLSSDMKGGSSRQQMEKKGCGKKK